MLAIFATFFISFLTANSLSTDGAKIDAVDRRFDNERITDNHNGKFEKVSVVKLKKNTNLKRVLIEDSKKFLIYYDYDLQGDTIFIGKNCILDFRGGSLNNGIIVGQYTKIRGNKSSVFSKIKVSGTWNVPKLSSRLFKDCAENNVLAQLFNLTDSHIQNKVIIEKGTYYVSVSRNNEGALLPQSNTEIVLKGTVAMRPNPLISYHIFSAMGVKNIYIHGGGIIRGDMYEHEYQENTSSEWGHGLVIRGCENVLVDGITIKDCTGDCCSVGAVASYDVFKPVPVGTPSYKVELRNCKFESSRRQGLTVGFATDVIVDKCEFSGIYSTYKGTEPGAGIDIEPDNVGVKKIKRGCDVANVIIKNSSFKNLRFGVLAWKTDKEDDTRNYERLRIEKCTFDDILRNSVFIAGFKDAVVKSCESKNIRWGVGFSNCENSYEVDCKILN